ncbi:MAG TPA: hydrogenase small subunit [Candidatus Kryptonia bacterium]|nr:hydrogenase small subunit [Candidatus Kryptonia bacterium]
MRKESNLESETIGQHLVRCGVSRREFLEFCASLMVAAPFGLALTNKARASEVAREVAQARRPSVIWLHFQDCTGCTETLLRTSKPDLAELILHLVSLDYHETLMAAAGKQAEEALATAMKENAGKYVLVVEGSIPRKDKGIYMKLAGRPALQVLEEVGSQAAAIIAIGSCASWGGIPSADPNPTDAVGVDSIITSGKPIINIPGCPPNPYTLLGTVLQFAINGTLPELDDLKRPKFAFDRNIHDHCPRRPHFDAGRFAAEFGDEGHRHGWCLYHLGCKGPETHAGCSTRHFNEVPDVWPIGIGAPCVGCTEQHLAFRVPMFQIAKIHQATPPDTYAPLYAEQGHASAVAAGVAGLIGGALIGAGYMASRKLGSTTAADSEAGPKDKE